MLDTSYFHISSNEARSKFQEFKDTFDKTLLEITESSSKFPDNDIQDSYYIDAFRWPEKAVKNIAKQKTIQALCLPEKHNFEVTTQCILKCEFCVLHSGALLKRRSKSFMDYADFKDIFTQLEPFVTHIEFTGGEPLLNKDLFRMVSLCNRHHVKTTIATNAQLLNNRRIEEMLEAPPSILLLAYESGHNLSYRAHRKGGSFRQLSKNLVRLIEFKKQRRQPYPRIQLQTIVSRKTVEQLEYFWENAKNSGVDSACIKPILIWPDGSPEYQQMMIDDYLIPEHPLSYHTLTQAGELCETRIPNFCPNIKTVHIGTGGEVVPCWYNLLTSPSMGNVNKEHFFDIWFSEKYQKFRMKMTSHTAYEHKCHHCIGIYNSKLFKFKNFK